MGTATESAYRASLYPADFDAFWERRAARATQPRELACEPAGISTSRARYLRLRFLATDGTELVARAVVPTSPGDHPCVLLFHDMDRGPRGWFHLTRFCATDDAVVELERRPWSADVAAGWEGGPEGLALAQLIDDALVCAHVAAGLPGVDGDRLITWGEGAGGALAIDVAALHPGVVCCGALNPTFADLRASWEAGATGAAMAGVVTHFRTSDPAAERADKFFSALAYVDTAAFMARLRCELLLGVSLMDQLAPARGQLAAFDAATCPKRLVTYPKYGHERINDFENRLLGFVLCGLFGQRGPEGTADI